MNPISSILERLNDEHFIYDWDEISDEVLRRTSFDPEEAEAVLLALNHIKALSGLCETSYHVLRYADESGVLLERGAVVALQSECYDALDELIPVSSSLPKRASVEFCNALQGRVNQESNISRVLNSGVFRRMLKRCNP